MNAALSSVRIRDILARITLVLLHPKTCWDTIALQTPSARTTALTIIAPLAVLAVLGPVVGHKIFGVDVEFFGLWRAPLFYSFTNQSLEIVMMITSLCIDSWMLSTLAPHFHRSVSTTRAWSLVANASIPAFLGWALGIIPALLHLKVLTFAYSFYILFFGFDKMIPLNANAPKNDTKPAFFSSAFALMLIIHVIMHALVEPIAPSPFFDMVW